MAVTVGTVLLAVPRAVLLAGLVWVGLAVAPAGAAEEILSFHAEVQVLADSSLEVSETIRVRAEGRQIRRGIFRDLPTLHAEPSGLLRSAGFRLLETLRDGRPEPHRTESIAAGTRIYLGDADTILRPGEYTYTIRYRTTRQLRYFDDGDELYWNVTGNFWAFPIRRASATVHLPQGAQAIRHAVYTGPVGSTAANAEASTSGPGAIAVHTTAPLRAGEGLTIAIAWPKGFVSEPGALSRMVRLLLDNVGLLLLGLGLVGVPAYFAWAWHHFGKDPARGTIIPLFHPPEELTPAGVSYLYYQGFRKKRGVSRAFLAALVALAVRRHVTIREDDGTVTLERGEVPAGASAGPGELSIYHNMLGSRESLAFTKANGTAIASALARFDGAIEGTYGRGRYFRRNMVWFLVGAALSVAALLAFVFTTATASPEAVAVMPFALFSGLAGLLLAAGVRRLRGSVPGGSYIVGALALIAGLVVLAPLAAAVLLLPVTVATALALTAAVLLPVVTVAFYHLMPAPTVQGRRLMDEVEGFRMYLDTAERERMNLVGSPEMSVELFERYLPYAVGLDVERPWSDAYAAHLARTLPGDRAAGYQPAWYVGRRWNSANIARSTSAVAGAVASGMARAVPSSSSGSSGSRGGGFSGGGGGGGGGGGW